MKIKCLLFLLLFVINLAHSQSSKKNIRYEYKKYEKFDLGEIGVSGDMGSPGDISISPGLRKEFRNKLPEKNNFEKEMKRSIHGIR